MDFTEVSNQIASELKNLGWTDIKFSVKLPNSSGTFDVVAKNKGFRKKQLVISIGSDPNDATLASMLLNGLDDKFEKIFDTLSDELESTEEMKKIFNVNIHEL